LAVAASAAGDAAHGAGTKWLDLLARADTPAGLRSLAALRDDLVNAGEHDGEG
jgi:hypothetical protein